MRKKNAEEKVPVTLVTVYVVICLNFSSSIVFPLKNPVLLAELDAYISSQFLFLYCRLRVTTNNFLSARRKYCADSLLNVFSAL